MNNRFFGTALQWNVLLLITVLFAVFIHPVLPDEWQRMTFKLDYSLIYISAFFSLEKRGRWIMALFLFAFLVEWISGALNLSYLYYSSRILKVLFFVVIIVRLIRQIATAKGVTIKIIIESVTGYLLLGLMFSIFVSVILLNNPAAYTNLPLDGGLLADYKTGSSFSMYYTFVTYSSLGYGDIAPISPVARSLATFIAVIGQLYIAIIIALLVGKFSAVQNMK